MLSWNGFSLLESLSPEDPSEKLSLEADTEGETDGETDGETEGERDSLLIEISLHACKSRFRMQSTFQRQDCK